MTSLRRLLNDHVPGFSRSYKTFDTSHNRSLDVRPGKPVYANGPRQESKELILNIDPLDGVPPAKDTSELCVKCHLERGENPKGSLEETQARISNWISQMYRIHPTHLAMLNF